MNRPAFLSHPSIVSHPSDSPSPAVVAAGVSARRILVIDDDLALCTLLAMLFQRSGYHTDSERDLHAAKQRLETERYDLIILDINIIYGSGLDLLTHLRQTLQLDTPVIVVSAMQQEATLIRSLELGADEYVPKPFSPRELLGRVEKFFNP